MLSPIHFRAQSSKLPIVANLLIPVLHITVAMASVSHVDATQIRVALVCSAYLMNGNNLTLIHTLVSDSPQKVLSVDKWISHEIWGAHHRNEFLGFHERDA